MRTFLFAVFYFVSLSGVFAQSDSTKQMRPLFPQEGKEFGLIAGINQYDNTFFELGFSKLSYRSNGCAFGTDIHGFTVSGEYNPFGKRAGFSVTTWSSMMAFIMMGFDLNTYTDLNKWDLGIKPFMGIGPGNWQLVYGYNIRLIDNQLGGVNKHGCFSLRFHIPLVRRENALFSYSHS